MNVERTLSLAVCGRVLVFLKRGHDKSQVKVEPQVWYPQLPRTVVALTGTSLSLLDKLCVL